MMQMRMAAVAALALAVAACGPQASDDTVAPTPVGEVTSPTAEAVMPPTVAAKPPAAADLTVDQLPGEPATGEIQSTASGLRYVVLAEGSGDKPTADSNVTVHYTGYLTDGTKFDSSVDRGEPAKFGLNAVIAGWTEGLQLMSPGAKYKLIVPSELGYGPAGFPPVIPGNADLVFDVELLEVAPQ